MQSVFKRRPRFSKKGLFAARIASVSFLRALAARARLRGADKKWAYPSRKQFQPSRSLSCNLSAASLFRYN